MSKVGRPTKYKAEKNLCGIYGLAIDGEIRYIGQSTNIHKRYAQHCSPAQNQGRTKKQNWLRKNLNKGIKPELVILEVTKDLDVRETHWINLYRHNGSKLVNIADGGKSLAHANRAKASNPWGTKHSPVQRSLMEMRRHITFLRKRGEHERANDFENKYKDVLEKIQSFGLKKMNMILWEKYGN